MGFFVFDGKNSIFQDLVAQLPNGTIYLKQNNIIPVAQVVTFVEQFDTAVYPVGTDVNIYVNNTYTATVKVTPSKAIYYKMATPYGKFQVKTEVGGITYSDDPFYAFNLFSFLVALSKTYNYDYLEIFKMFGNIYDKYLQDDILYNKIGWFYDFSRPFGWDIEDYRNILIGSTKNYQINHLFMNSMTYWSMYELVKSFTGIYPYIYTYRDEYGWVLSSDYIAQNAGFKNYYLVKEWTYTGVNDVAGLNLNGYTLLLQLGEIVFNLTFPTTTGGTDIANYINANTGGTLGFLASIVMSGSNEYLKLEYNYPNDINNVMIIQGGSAVVPLGFQIVHFQQDDFVDTDDDICTLYDEAFVWNKIDLVIRNSTKTITENVTKSSSAQDRLKHNDVIDTPLHPLTIAGYVKGVDYKLLEDPIGSMEYYVYWLNPNVFMQGTINVAGLNLIGQGLTLSVNNLIVSMIFNNTIGGADIASQINSRLGGIYATVVTIGIQEFIRLDGWGIKIITGSAVSALGFSYGQQTGLPQKNEQYIVIYSYFMKEELVPLCELNKPAYLKINYYFLE